MKGILILLICVLLISPAYSKPDVLMDNTSKYELKVLSKRFILISYDYTLMSITMFHQEMAFLGISSLSKKLAEDKLKLADTIMDYLVKRRATDKNSIFLLESERGNREMKYKRNAEEALAFLFRTEKETFEELYTAVSRIMDTHVKHFLTHTVMAAQQDHLARIGVLHSKLIDRGSDFVYQYEFDRYANFYYKNVFVTPTEISF